MIQHVTVVKELALSLGIWDTIRSGVRQRLMTGDSAPFLDILARMEVRPSRATLRLGSYLSRNGTPLAIRLQFAQEPDQLRETLLHEIAHACDHLQRLPGRPYRQPHGEPWRIWMAAFGLDADRRGESVALQGLHRQRLKVVAICRDCGAEIRRVRRLNRRRVYLHTICGGRVVPL